MSVDDGRYGRMFRALPPFQPSDAQILALARSMDDPAGAEGDNADIPSGYTSPP